jgi:hypothetical protein
MSTTQTVIGEYDEVRLRAPYDGWPAGTRGIVVAVFPTHRWVEVADERGERDLVWAPTDGLELVRKTNAD